jgi:hypothetical protein
MPVFGTPTFKIFFFRVSGQINKTTLAALKAGKLLFHNLSLLALSFTGLPHCHHPRLAFPAHLSA